MSYVDGFVTPVKNANKQAYLEHAEQAYAMFKQHGMLSFCECWGDDVPDGKLTSFPMAVKKEDDETVVFSWIVWPSKNVRDAAWAAIMNDPAMSAMSMPFDGRRMIYGGFEVLIRG